MKLDDNVTVFYSPLEAQFTGHMRETRKLVVAISLSGSAVSFSFTGARGTFGGGGIVNIEYKSEDSAFNVLHGLHVEHGCTG